MDSLTVVPADVVGKLKCCFCDGPLSVPPITLITQDGNQYKCGRCISIKSVPNIRAVIYEHLAKLMLFPCIYKSCLKTIPFEDVHEHEKICEHRTTICPKVNCSESMKISMLSQHFKDKHSDTYHTNSFIIKNVYAYNNIDLLEKNGKTYISIFDSDDNYFALSVCALDPIDTCQYEVNVKSEKNNFGIVVLNQNMIAFNNRLHCLKCANGSCKLKFHAYKDNKKDLIKKMSTKINRDCVKRMFGGGLLTYTIDIIEEDRKIKEEPKPQVKDAIIRKAKKIFLQLLECPLCKEYMSAPIYQCLSGHTICNVCRPALEKCSTCEERIEKTRNFTLEELSSKVELPISDEKKIKAETGTKRPSDELNNTNGDVPVKVQKN